MNRSFAIQSYFRYLLKARHRKGFGIHSPFVFQLLNSVFFEQTPYYCYEDIEETRADLRENSAIINVTDFGSGNYAQRRIRDIVSRSTKRAKYAQLLFRLANSNQSRIMLELGTCIGLTTLYLAAANKSGRVITMDGDSESCRLAKENFRKHKANNIELHQGEITSLLPDILKKTPYLDFVFFDANHTKKATLNYFDLCLTKANEHTIFVFDDIYRNREMYEAWCLIKENKKIRLGIDIFEMGIAFFNTDLIKQEYVVAF